ncbi:MAG TPA: substrate-binding domain-containing protein [Terracidiphilus sp.]|nr:substrate-binding domain-containing protein [Terracidiphilus sp.]
MKTAKWVALAALAAGVFFVSGCKRHSVKEVYYLVSNNTGLPYWKTAAAGFNHAAAQLGVTAKVVGPQNYDIQDELSEFKSAVASKPSGILVTAQDVAVLQPEIDAAIQAGVPVITIDSDAAGSHRLFFIGTNNLDAGRLGGRRLAEKLGGKGNVVFFTIAGQPNLEERLKGFKDVLETRPGIHIAEVVDIKGDPRVAFDESQKLLAQTGPKKIDAFVCLEASTGRQVAEVIRRMNVKDRVVITWDTDQAILDAIKAGTIDSTVAQKPYTMGFVGLNALDNIFHNPPKQLDHNYSADPFSRYPVFIDTGTSLVDKENVDPYITAAAQMEK